MATSERNWLWLDLSRWCGLVVEKSCGMCRGARIYQQAFALMPECANDEVEVTRRIGDINELVRGRNSINYSVIHRNVRSVLRLVMEGCLSRAQRREMNGAAAQMLAASMNLLDSLAYYYFSTDPGPLHRGERPYEPPIPPKDYVSPYPFPPSLAARTPTTIGFKYSAQLDYNKNRYFADYLHWGGTVCFLVWCSDENTDLPRVFQLWEGSTHVA